MDSEIRMKCWICPETFNKGLELKNHAIDKHDVCRVVCPWCIDSKETYKRISELAKHSKRKHRDLVEELKNLDFFSEANGFWLALRPLDYGRVVKANDRTSETAIRTRAAILGWTERREGNKRERETLEREWDRALGFTPVHETPKNKKRKLQEYTPEVQQEVELVIDEINLSSSCNAAFLRLEEGVSQLWYHVELNPKVVSDRKSLDNLLRRMSTAKRDLLRPKEFKTELKIAEANFTVKQLTNALGIGDTHILQVWREMRCKEITEKELQKSQEELMEIGEKPDLDISIDMDIIKEVEDNNKNEEEEQIGSSEHEENNLNENTAQANLCGPKEDDDKNEGEPELVKPEKEKKTIKERAEDLLRTGGMPLFPPGRRQWDSRWQIIVSRNPTTMYWPPKGWENMSPEERLTSWRFVAFTLERETGLASCSNERDILDKYSMLGLPGTALPKTMDRSRITHTRTANFNIVKRIFKGDIKAEEAETWLTVFEGAASTNRGPLHLLEAMRDIPVRVDKDDDL